MFKYIYKVNYFCAVAIVVSEVQLHLSQPPDAFSIFTNILCLLSQCTFEVGTGISAYTLKLRWLIMVMMIRVSYFNIFK
jgi:hypothetical protein